MRIQICNELVLLDTTAARHHRLDTAADCTLPLSFWLTLFSEADQLRVHALIHSDIQPDRTESIAARLRWSVDGAPPTLELACQIEPNGRDVLCVCRDVTAAQSLEDSQRQRVAAERASQAKSEFMSQVSHELRTPLNSILGFAQLMAMDIEQPLPSKQRERLQMLQHSSLRLLGLVDQLLQIGRIEQGKLNLRLRSVNVHSLVRHCAEALAPMAEEYNVSIELNLGGNHASAVKADPHALEQVLINLLSNGIKYNRNGGRVTVRFEVTDEAHVTVHDTGNGLTSSQIAHLFEPFNRLDAAHSRIQGAGLGLVISRKLVEEMRGTLHVWSEIAVGSRFRVSLPRARDARRSDGETLPLDMPSQWSAGDQFRVLYIEDDEVNIVLMDQLFATQPEWQLTVAMSGSRGLAEAIKSVPDLILLDLGLPDMTGWEVRRQLRLEQRTRDIPVIAVSADAMPPNQRRSRAAGFEDYWTKPLNLLATIDKLKALCTSARPP